MWKFSNITSIQHETLHHALASLRDAALSKNASCRDIWSSVKGRETAPVVAFKVAAGGREAAPEQH